MQASSGVIQNCRGVNLDGTSTNRKAMRAMEEEHPHMVNLVCAAHSLDLVIKDLGNVGKTKTECGKVLQQAKDLAAAVGECEKLRAVLQRHQVEKYGKVSRCCISGNCRAACMWLWLWLCAWCARACEEHANRHCVFG
jgi:hypothetical protein